MRGRFDQDWVDQYLTACLSGYKKKIKKE